MKEELAKLLMKERKNKRELAELRALRSKVSQQVNPDQKVLKQIDDAIGELLK